MRLKDFELYIDNVIVRRFRVSSYQYAIFVAEDVMQHYNITKDRAELRHKVHSGSYKIIHL